MSASEKAATSRLFSYTAIALVQLRAIWGIWRNADLTNGDSSYYFSDAATWAHTFHLNFVDYPLYDALWGTILIVVRSVYGSTIIQRVLIIYLVTFLVLGVTRKLLAPAIALLVTAWWISIPSNSDPLYEIHLLGAATPLVVILIVARWPQRRGIGAAIGVLLASAVLTRSEFVLAAILFALVALVYELRLHFKRRCPPVVEYMKAYLLPLFLVSIVALGTYSLSYVQGSAVSQQLRTKEAQGFAQFYSIDYQQEFPSQFTGNPWVDFAPLMHHLFRQTEPTFLSALAANPPAVVRFVGWNLRLYPAAIQVALLGASSFRNNPGNDPAILQQWYPNLLTVLAILIVLIALVIQSRRYDFALRGMPSRSRWILLTMFLIATTEVIIGLGTRPWDEYIYGLTICFLILVGWSGSIVFLRYRLSQALAPLSILVIATLLALLPSFYPPGQRPLYDALRELQIAKSYLARPNSILVANSNANILCNYLARDHFNECTGLAWQSLRVEVNATTSVADALSRAHARVIFADSGLLADPLFASFVATASTAGWRQLSQGSGPSGPWRVLVRRAIG